MVKAWLVAGMLSALVPTVALAQTWSEAKVISKEESPLELKLQGWGKSAIKTARQATGETNDRRGTSYFHSVFYQNESYEAYVGLHEAAHFVHWNQNTIQNIAKRYFKEEDLEFGSYIDVDHGRAEYRAIPSKFTKNGKAVNCWTFRAYWDRFSSDGYLCSRTATAPSDAAIRTFITHISYKTALEPKGEGVLPPS
ncbi:MAG: hypothetical protein ACOVKO_02480 [Elstera sp.]